MTKLVRRTMLVGLGAALFLAGSAHAQQGVDPSSFSDSDPVGAGFEQNLEENFAQSIELNVPQHLEQVIEQDVAPIDGLQIVQDTGVSMQLGIENKVATAILGSYPPGEESDLRELKLMDTMLVWTLVVGTGLIACYAKTFTRGERTL